MESGFGILVEYMPTFLIVLLGMVFITTFARIFGGIEIVDDEETEDESERFEDIVRAQREAKSVKDIVYQEPPKHFSEDYFR